MSEVLKVVLTLAFTSVIYNKNIKYIFEVTPPKDLLR